MAGNEENNAAERPIPLPLGLAAQPESAELNSIGKPRNFITAGENIHHWATYLGIDWILNTLSGVGFAYFTKYTKAGRKYWSDPITSAFDKGLQPFIRNDAMRQASAGYGNMFMSIIAGGMFTLPPLMLLESRKIKSAIVQFLDRRIYGKDKVENAPKFREAYEALEHEPKKDFTSGLAARFAALAPLLAIVLTPTTKKASDKVWFNYFEKGSDIAATKLGFGPESFKKVSPEQGKERWKFIHESVAMDAGLGIIYAGLHSIFYNIIAGIRGKRHPQAQEVKPVLKDAPPLLVENASAQDKDTGERRMSHAEREMKRETAAANSPDPGAAR